MSEEGQKHDQWIRKVSLIVAGAGDKGLDLSAFRVNFEVSQSDFETPNIAIIRVYNLSASTAQKIRKEFTQVTLQAGYQDGAFGIVFQGTIKQVRIGRDSQTDTYLDIFAADSDEQYNFGMVNKSVAAGTSPKAQTEIIAKEMGAQVGDIQYDTGLQDNIRGKVLYGQARSQLRNLARSGKATWSLQNGKVVVQPLTGYSKGQAVVINSTSGMVGLPEQTEEGIKVTCLLNPKIAIGTQVQINESSVQRAAFTSFDEKNKFTVLFGPEETRQNTIDRAFPPVTSDGSYFVMVHEMKGDTRANEYYSFLTCLAINKTVPAGSSVKAAG